MAEITQDYIAEKIGIWTTANDIKIFDPIAMADVTRQLDEALARKAGHPWFNPNGYRVNNFDMVYFTARTLFYGQGSGLQCLIRNKANGKEFFSAVALWPRNDFWAVLVDINTYLN
jgi:hypothetical protein